MSKSNLTIKQAMFCQKFVETGNATEAYRFAYSVDKMTDKTTWEKASILKAKDKVKARIEQLRQDEEDRVAGKFHISRDRLMKEYIRHGLSDVRKTVDEDGNTIPLNELDDETAAAIIGVEITESEKGTTYKYKFTPKQAPLQDMAKMIGLFAEDNKQKEKVVVVKKQVPGWIDEASDL